MNYELSTIYPLTLYSVIFRTFLSVFLSGIVGFERGLKNRPAGLRTYMLVSLGACMIMMVNQYVTQAYGIGDPAWLGAQVVSGIGFLGAGTIIVTKHNGIKGLKQQGFGPPPASDLRLVLVCMRLRYLVRLWCFLS